MITAAVTPSGTAPSQTALALEVRDLSTHLPTREGVVRAVDHLSFDVAPGEIVGIVGESGCGKSMLALSLLGLVPAPGGIAGGSVRLAGQELVGMSTKALRGVRGRGIGMVFQDPMSSLNPVMKIGAQVGEAARLHLGLSKAEAKRRARQALELVRFPRAAERFDDYPHQLSGGMRQRVMIAAAIVCEPQVLIADEPTTALDVTTEARILDALANLRRETGTSIVLITHDIGMISSRADRLLVMYAGRIVEEGAAAAVVSSPRHPYTDALLGSVLTPDTPRRSRLATIDGAPPDLRTEFSSCRFAPRCPYRQDACLAANPALERTGERAAACLFPLERAS